MRLDLEATIRAAQIMTESGTTEKFRNILEKNGDNFDGKAFTMLVFDAVVGAFGKNVSDDTVALLAYVFDKSEQEIRTTPLSELIREIKAAAKGSDAEVFFRMCLCSESPE